MDAYNSNNVFAKILKGELPCTIVYENDHVLAFNDIARMAPDHVLVIPKEQYVCLYDVLENALNEDIAGFWKGLDHTANLLGVDAKGSNLFTSVGGTHGRRYSTSTFI